MVPAIRQAIEEMTDCRVGFACAVVHIRRSGNLMTGQPNQRNIGVPVEYGHIVQVVKLAAEKPLMLRNRVLLPTSLAPHRSDILIEQSRLRLIPA